MRLVVAPDSFKGSLTALEAALSIEKGIKAVVPDAIVQIIPLADGGEGMVDAILCAAGGHSVEVEVTGPLGRPVKATFGILQDGSTGVIEVSSACGLTQVPPERRDPEATTSFGVGELIMAAIGEGCRKLIIGLGGSATNDCGVGMAAALGIRFLDDAGRLVEPRVTNLAHMAEIDFSDIDPGLASVEITGAYDVSSPLCGPNGATAVFGPQKGATPEQLNRLDALLKHMAELIKKDTGRDVFGIPGTGAAGGLGAGLVGFLGGHLVPGSKLVLELSGIDKKLAEGEIDMVITGEGEINEQTALGKAPVAVASLAKKYGLPVVAVVGGIGLGASEVYRHGIDAIYSIIPRPMELAEAMQNAVSFLEEATERMVKLILLKKRT